jgi:hypothetical protein
MVTDRKNYFCNFRAPNRDWYQVWLDFKEATKSQGLDNCFVVLALCKAWLKARKETISVSQINTATQIILIYQTNAFNYNVEKPRRERFLLDCSPKLRKCTTCSKAFQAYIVETARELNRSFSFKDFPEINHDLFRKLILELRKRHKILALKPRTNPRFFILREWQSQYPTLTENNTVKPEFTANQPSEITSRTVTSEDA